jgi:putative SOS response-associated peptidase YedK
MCGRYTLTAEEMAIRNRFRATLACKAIPQRYNLPPTAPGAVVIHEGGERKIKIMRWGLIPYWWNRPQLPTKTFNAMSETAMEKPSYRTPFRKKRCLIPADGFYEWKEVSPRKKVPFRFVAKDGGLFAFAGLWDSWKDPTGQVIESFTMMTTLPNSIVAQVNHERMPVILSLEEEDRWLDPNLTDVKTLTSILDPFPGEQMASYQVPLIVSKGVDSPECISAVEGT